MSQLAGAAIRASVHGPKFLLATNWAELEFRLMDGFFIFRRAIALRRAPRSIVVPQDLAIAGGHVTEAMRQLYDHSVPEVSAAVKPEKKG